MGILEYSWSLPGCIQCGTVSRSHDQGFHSSATQAVEIAYHAALSRYNFSFGGPSLPNVLFIANGFVGPCELTIMNGVATEKSSCQHALMTPIRHGGLPLQGLKKAHLGVSAPRQPFCWVLTSLKLRLWSYERQFPLLHLALPVKPKLFGSWAQHKPPLWILLESSYLHVDVTKPDLYFGVYGRWWRLWVTSMQSHYSLRSRLSTKIESGTCPGKGLLDSLHYRLWHSRDSAGRLTCQYGPSKTPVYVRWSRQRR